jgi:glutaminyl-peptide cyclotransferase
VRTTALNFLLLALFACSRANSVTAKNADPTPAANAAAAGLTQNAPGQNAPVPPPDSPDVHVSGTRALAYTREMVAMGPRPIGSPAHTKLENYLRQHLKSDNLEEDTFTADTPKGKFPGRNFIAKFPGRKDGIVVIAGHYETKMLKNFVGANDGGASAGLLLELANHLAAGKKPRDGYSVWLVWFDAEEAVKEWSDTDSTYGSRHLAEKWQQDGTAKKIKGLLLVDMIGDADLNIDRDQNSTPWLEGLVYQAASRFGYQSYFFGRQIPDFDDHIPFAKIGVPVADLIDLDYGYNNVFWHTPQDTMDKLSAKSLEVAGTTVVETVRLLDTR